MNREKKQRREFMKQAMAISLDTVERERERERELQFQKTEKQNC